MKVDGNKLVGKMKFTFVDESKQQKLDAALLRIKKNRLQCRDPEDDKKLSVCLPKVFFLRELSRISSDQEDLTVSDRRY